jgi:hypothetical protein
MNDEINYHAEDSSTYSFRLIDGIIKLDCYLIGSISGGFGTECFHTIGNENISSFLESLSCDSLGDLSIRLRNYQLDQWDALHAIVLDFQTDSFTWTETNWDE